MRARGVVVGLGALILASCGAGVSRYPGTEPRPDAPYDVLTVRDPDAGTDTLAATDALTDMSASDGPRSDVGDSTPRSDGGYDLRPGEAGAENRDSGADDSEDAPQDTLDAPGDLPPLVDGVPETAPPADVADDPPPRVVQFSLPIQNVYPAGITLGPDGNIWFTEVYGNKIGRITPDGAIMEYGGLTEGSGPERICAGPDGYLWFTETNTGKIGRMSVMGDVTEYTGSVDSPGGITPGPDGNIWFVEHLKIGRITPLGDDLIEYGLPVDARAVDIVPGSDGNLWVSDLNGLIYRVTLAGVITPFETPTLASGVLGIASDPLTGRLWFTEGAPNANQIGTVVPKLIDSDPATAMSEFPIRTVDSGAVGIVAGTDGDAWFTENHTGRIGHVNADGDFTEFGIPSSGSTRPTPVNIAADRNGSLWFTDSGSNSIGRLSRR